MADHNPDVAAVLASGECPGYSDRDRLAEVWVQARRSWLQRILGIRKGYMP